MRARYVPGRYQSRAYGIRYFLGFASAGSAAKLDLARRYGADHLINHSEEAFAPRVKELSGGRGADVIYDPVGGDVFEQSLRCLNSGGRLLVIGFAVGAEALGLTLAVNRHVFSVNVPVGYYFNRFPNPYTGTAGDATFPKWVAIATYSTRFGGKPMEHHAASADEALEKVRSESPAVVLLDVWMPGRDGLEILPEVRRLAPTAVVVMISGHGTIETAIKATRLVELRFGSPASLTLSLNGRILDRLGEVGVAGGWAFTADGGVTPSNRK